MAVSDVVRFYADVKPCLSALQVMISFPETIRDKSLCVAVTESCVSVASSSCICGEQTAHHLVCCFQLTSVSIAPQTCHGLQVTASGTLHLRFQLDDIGKSTDAAHGCSECKSKSCGQSNHMHISEPSKGVKLSADLLQNEIFIVCCKMCGAALFDSHVFNRVLDLPSDNWLDSSETWWCHGGDSGHCHDEMQDEKHLPSGCHGETLLPIRTGDCLISDVSLVVLEHAFKIGSYLCGDKSCLIRCRRCLNVVGRDMLSGKFSIDAFSSTKMTARRERCVHLSTYAVSVLKLNDQPPVQWAIRSEELEFNLSSYFLEEQSQSSHFRFIIEARNDRGDIVPKIMMWILDSNTSVFIGQHVLSSSTSNHRLIPLPVLKLLYKDCLRDGNKVAGQVWYRDMSVHNVELPEAVCHQLLKCLVDSTVSLPVPLRTSGGGFYVGYLRRSQMC